MKKNYGIFFGFAVLLMTAIFALAGCGDNGDPTSPPGGDPQTITYSGTSNGTTFTLKITENTSRAVYTPQSGDSYELTVGGNKSAGSVASFSGGTFTLKPSNSQTTFSATVSGTNLTSLSGTITWTGGGTEDGPGALTAGGGGDPDLSGTIVIQANNVTVTSVTVGTQLTAVYSGTETVTYQWKRGNTNVGTGTTYTPAETGNHTVTVSATGYKSKSASINVTTQTGGNPPAGPGTGGNPVLNTGEIWKDDGAPTVGMLFISGDVYYYHLNNGTWGSREKIGTWDGGNTIAAVYSVDPDTTFTVSGNKLYEYRETTNALVATYTKTTGQTISGQTGSGSTGGEFVGTWTKPAVIGNATLVFNTGNTFLLTNPLTTTYNGTYTVAGSTATLTGTGTGGANATGTATISGDTLTLSVAMLSLNGTYTKSN